MARLRERTSNNKCDKLLMTFRRLEVIRNIDLMNNPQRLIMPVQFSEDSWKWKDYMFQYNLKRFKNATKQKRSIR